MKIATSILDLVGKTPLVELKKWSAKRNLAAQIVVKLERQNPAGSVKDRVALAMIDEAEKDGSLVPGMTIVEPTSGNTGRQRLPCDFGYAGNDERRTSPTGSGVRR